MQWLRFHSFVWNWNRKVQFRVCKVFQNWSETDMQRLTNDMTALVSDTDMFGERLDQELEPEDQDVSRSGTGIVLEFKQPVAQTQKPSKSFWDNPRPWPKMVLSMLCSVFLVLAVAVFCAFLYIIIKGMPFIHINITPCYICVLICCFPTVTFVTVSDRSAERMLGEDGTEVRVLGEFQVDVLRPQFIPSPTFSATYFWFDSFPPCCL